MRMRRKKHLDERMNAVSDIILAVENSEFFEKAESERYEPIDFFKVFGNSNPVELEIGCGKCGFISELAKRNRDVNYLAVEKLSNVLIVGAEEIKKQNLTNVKLLNVSAENLKYYLPIKSVEKIYLNFSCPYPKGSYKNRRLTNPRFLELYKSFLKPDGCVFQKTDNMHFFEYSVESFSSCGYVFKNVNLDLYNSDFEGNIPTEYEKKFSAMGLPIYRLEAYLKNDNDKKEQN